MVVALSFAALGAVLVACGSDTPPIQPAAPQVQQVPGMASSDMQPAETYCLAQGLRVFVSTDGHGRRIFSVVNVINLPPFNAYRCS